MTEIWETLITDRRAVNAHDGLVRAVTSLLSYPDGHTNQCRYRLYGELCDCGLDNARDRARAALSLAKGQDDERSRG